MLRSFISLCLVLYLSSLMMQMATILWLNHYGNAADHRDSINMGKGMNHLLYEDLMRHPPAERAARIDQLRPEFGFPIGLSSWEESKVEGVEREALARGEVIITPRIFESETFHFRLEDSDQVVWVGPVDSLSEWEDVLAKAELIHMLGLVLVLFGWVARLAYRLNKLNRATLALGDGDLTIRAKLPGRDLVASLAGTFNQMAARLQRLIEGHKELTNAVSHELRTPISRLAFEVEMVRNSQSDSQRERHLEGMENDIAELSELTSELLTYARFDRGHNLNQQPIVLATWLREWLDGWRSPSPLERACEVPKDLERWTVTFDPDYLERALSNLLSNAARYGGSRVVVTIGRVGADCVVHVDDDGPGIPLEHRENLFQPFSLLEPSRNRASGGFGLGLSIVAQVMRSFRGEASIADSPLGGARISLRWPSV